jgi:excisionase family DNA binding protein
MATNNEKGEGNMTESTTASFNRSIKERTADAHEPLYTIAESAEQTRMSVAWWRQMVFQRRIRFLKVGRRVLIPESTIRGLLSKSVVEPKDRGRCDV